MEIVRIGPDDVGRVYEAEDLFDGPIREAAAGRFLRTEDTISCWPTWRVDRSEW